MQIKAETLQKIQKRFHDIEAEYQNWRSSHKELARYINPTRGRFDDVPNRGTMINHKEILDDHATQCSRILASGMQTGMTSPSRPWFKVEVDNEEAMKVASVGMWCDAVTNLMLDVCSQSNVYGGFFSQYEEIGDFGVSAAIVLSDYDKVIRMRTFTIGEYFLGVNDQGIVDTFGRRFQMTSGQLVKKFGYENCSANVQNLWDTNRKDVWIKVEHLIEPNDTKIEGFVDNQNMPFRSIYWEVGQNLSVLSKGGFRKFPVLAPRWDIPTTDMVYGYGPGWFALGHVKQLQKTHLDKLLAQEKSHNPPVQKDASVDGFVDLLPGGVTATSSSLPNAGIRPAYQVNTNLESFIELINGLKDSIKKDFFVDLFLMMINFDKSNMTATEVAERQQEKMMMLGPVVERLQKEMLDPFLDILYDILEDNNLLPVPPKEISGQNLKIKYVSILAQAQRAVGVNAISRVIGFISAVTPYKQDASDVLDIDEAIREVAKMEGIAMKLMPDRRIIQQIRDQRAQALQTQQNLAAMGSMAKAAKDAANAKLTEPSVLSGLQESLKR